MSDLTTVGGESPVNPTVLATIVCGIDGSAEAAEAAHQAAMLARPDARLELVGVIHAGVVESVAAITPARTTEPERRLRRRSGPRSMTCRRACPPPWK
jgi:hypothetical protein